MDRDEIEAALKGMADHYAAEREREQSKCYNCNGQGAVFPGVAGHPRIVDTSRVLTCPICHGTGKRELRLF
jgi:DnaJ-class molecular chaperone